MPLLMEWLADFLNPQKRIFWGFLLSSLLIALFWLFFCQRKSWLSSLHTVFNRETWLSRSARADYLLMFINSVILTLLSPRLLTQTAVAIALFTWLHESFHGRPLINEIAAWKVSLCFTFFLFVVDDFTRYWLHRWLHTIPFLWTFHKIHHSASTLNPLTVFRTHPVEAVLFSTRSALVQGFSIALFVFFFGDKVTMTTVLGASLFNFLFNVLGSNLRHSPVSIPYWRPLEKLLISPAQHHIHHSSAKQHIDKNFGVILSIWDLMFGSHCHSTPNQQLSYGITQSKGYKPHSLFNLYLEPILSVGTVVIYCFKQQWVKAISPNPSRVTTYGKLAQQSQSAKNSSAAAPLN